MRISHITAIQRRRNSAYMSVCIRACMQMLQARIFTRRTHCSCACASRLMLTCGQRLKGESCTAMLQPSGLHRSVVRLSACMRASSNCKLTNGARFNCEYVLRPMLTCGQKLRGELLQLSHTAWTGIWLMRCMHTEVRNCLAEQCIGQITLQAPSYRKSGVGVFHRIAYLNEHMIRHTANQPAR